MSRKPNAAERYYMELVAELGCLVCRNQGLGYVPCQLHHIRDGYGISQRAPHYLVVPLCPEHHKDGGNGVAFHAGKQTFQGLYGSEMDLLAQTIELLNQ